MQRVSTAHSHVSPTVRRFSFSQRVIQEEPGGSGNSVGSDLAKRRMGRLRLSHPQTITIRPLSGVAPLGFLLLPPPPPHQEEDGQKKQRQTEG